MAERTPPFAVASATVLLVRDGAGGLEVFMVERHHQIDFASSALVFPGGKVDPADRAAELRARCAGAAQLDDDALALRVAAVRETFEESGVLIARRRGAPGEALLAAAEVAPIAETARAELLAGRLALGEIAERHDLELATDALVPFAHWITPEFMPKRFDTHFFLVAAPADQSAAHDGGESVDSLWIEVGRAIEDAHAKRRSIIFPTLRNLVKLGRSRSVAEALERARREPIVTVLPRVARGADGPVIRIPPEAGYDLDEAPIDDLR
ncbi:MAG TPA: NUDIX domain-containing protein [Myxococcota bacterium]|nr:NUDIX domain-containing protein [Myxococcota bacterium]